MSCRTVYLAVVLSAALALPCAATQTDVDLELIVAVDVSYSMNLFEQRIQRDGYVAAFRHPQVIAAIRSGPFKHQLFGVGGAGSPSASRTLVVISSEEAARRFSASTPRR